MNQGLYMKISLGLFPAIGSLCFGPQRIVRHPNQKRRDHDVLGGLLLSGVCP